MALNKFLNIVTIIFIFMKLDAIKVFAITTLMYFF